VSGSTHLKYHFASPVVLFNVRSTFVIKSIAGFILTDQLYFCKYGGVSANLLPIFIIPASKVFISKTFRSNVSNTQTSWAGAVAVAKFSKLIM